jgi:triosephosphate isomerase (TIM)
VVPAQKQKNLMFAYEPVWAIGTGKVPTTHHIQTMALIIRKEIVAMGVTTEDSFPVLYGGSVNASNVLSIVGESTVDGVLVGGASLDPSNLVQMAKMLTK